MFSRFVLMLLLGLLWGPSWVLAARPFMTDDARLTTAGSCQLETWSRRDANRTELWALPACNPTGNLEITVGAAAYRETHNAQSADTVLQVKTLFRPMTPNSWGAGVALGQVSHRPHTASDLAQGQTYAYVPVSVSFMDDRWVSHTNVGWARGRVSGRDQFNWGMGLEYQINHRWMWIAETFGNDRQKPFWQTGLRYQVLPGLLQIDATWGAPVDAPQGQKSSQQWLSLGLRWTPTKFP